jgi:hypothetical protein
VLSFWVRQVLGALAPRPTSLNHLGLERWPPHPEGFVSEDSLSEASTAHPGLPRCWHSTVLAFQSPGTRSRRLVMACHCVTLEARWRALHVRRPSSVARPSESECSAVVLANSVLANVGARPDQAWAMLSRFRPLLPLATLHGGISRRHLRGATGMDQ